MNSPYSLTSNYSSSIIDYRTLSVFQRRPRPLRPILGFSLPEYLTLDLQHSSVYSKSNSSDNLVPRD